MIQRSDPRPATRPAGKIEGAGTGFRFPVRYSTLIFENRQPVDPAQEFRTSAEHGKKGTRTK